MRNKLFDDFKRTFIQEYAKDVPQKLLRKHVLGNNYIWHLFSWELISADKYLSGEDARRAYDSCDKSNALVIDEIADVYCVSITKDYLTAKEIGGMEIYVFAEDFSWVYLNTHEEGAGLGPYFIKK